MDADRLRKRTVGVRSRARRATRIAGGLNHLGRHAPRRAGASRTLAVESLAVDPAVRNAHATIVSACAAAATGFELCARRTGDGTIAVAAESAARHLRELVLAIIEHESGPDPRPRARTCERLRWEWLASTAMVLDGRSDRRLLSECARILTEAFAAVRVDVMGDELTARLRVASAEAYSLARAASQEPVLALGLAFS